VSCDSKHFGKMLQHRAVPKAKGFSRLAWFDGPRAGQLRHECPHCTAEQRSGDKLSVNEPSLLRLLKLGNLRDMVGCLAASVPTRPDRACGCLASPIIDMYLVNVDYLVNSTVPDSLDDIDSCIVTMVK